MALFTKPIESALKARDTATAEANEWESKAAVMRAEADQLDASANTAILEDESAAERITAQVLTLQRKAKAYEQAASEARSKARTAATDVLRIEADELDKEAAKINKTADKLEAEVTALREKLEALDGAKYSRLVEESDWDAIDGRYRTRIYHNGKAAGIKQGAKQLTTQAQVIRYWLEHGQIPTGLKALNDAFGEIHSLAGAMHDGAPITRYGDAITDNLREALNGVAQTADQ